MSAQIVLAATLVEPGEYELREYLLPEPAPGCVGRVCAHAAHLGQFITACHDLDAVVRDILLPNPTPHDETHRLLLQVPGASTAST